MTGEVESIWGGRNEVRAGDGGDGTPNVVKSGRAWSGARETCVEAECAVDAVVAASVGDDSEGDSAENAERPNERLETATLLRLASSGARRSGTVTISQNWKRGG